MEYSEQDTKDALLIAEGKDENGEALKRLIIKYFDFADKHPFRTRAEVILAAKIREIQKNS